MKTKKIKVFINNARSILNLYKTFFGGDVTIFMHPTPLRLTLLFVTNFGYPLPTQPRWRHFWMTPYFFEFAIIWCWIILFSFLFLILLLLKNSKKCDTSLFNTLSALVCEGHCLLLTSFILYLFCFIFTLCYLSLLACNNLIEKNISQKRLRRNRS